MRAGRRCHARSPRAPPRLPSAGLPWPCSRPRGDNGRGWRNPSRRRPRSSRSACSTTLSASTNSRQSMAPSRRRLPMLLPIDTWSAACSWVCALHQLLDGQVELRKALLDPGERQRERGALALQAARELGDEGAGHRRVRARHVGGGEDQALRIAPGDLDHALGPGVGEVALGGAGGDARGHAPQVLDQRQAQHDGDGPELAQARAARRSDTRRRSAAGFPRRAGHRRARSLRARCRRRAAALPTVPPAGAAARGCRPWAGGACRCAPALRSGGNCRAAIPRPARSAGRR